MKISMHDRVIRRTVVRVADKAVTTEIANLQEIGKLASKVGANRGFHAFLSGLKGDIRNRCGMALLFERVGHELNPRCRKMVFRNLIYNWNVQGAKLRRALIDENQWVPNLAVISPSMSCNLRCTGCYSGLYDKAGELTEEEIDGVLAELRNMGCYFVVVSGGEPYVKKEMWLRLFRKYGDMYFLTYTNGTLLDDKTVHRLACLGNVAPAISVEGYEEETDERRGTGTYRRVLEAMARLRREGVLFGISVTYTRNNVDLVSSDEFVRFFMDKGAIFAWYFMFMPVGKDPILELVPTPRQRYECGVRIGKMRKRHPMFLADFWNDGPAAGGCLAGGRSYLHILNDGRIEPCVFAHFGVDNIRDTTILEAVNSPYFKAIRGEFPYNNNGNLLRPCMIIDNPEVLRSVVREYVVPEGHPHSEDLIQDPEVVEWIDDYSREFRDIVDPVWEERISDPKDRWYREGTDYRNLFLHRKNKGVAPFATPADEREETAEQDEAIEREVAL